MSYQGDGKLRVCELCGRKFHAIACQDDGWVDASGHVVGYMLPLHGGALRGAACWRCAHEYMGVVGRRTPDGPICADCDTEDES